MAFTDDQLLTHADMVTLISDEGYIQKNLFDTSTELVTKAQITDALHLDGADPLSTYTSTQHVRYADISPLGTLWAGGDYICLDENTDDPPTAPSLVAGTVTASSINVDWGASPGTDDNSIYWYVIEISSDGGTNYGDPHTISDVLSTTRNYTYTGLSASTSYKFRVKSIDTIGQESGWSSILTQSTTAASTSQLELVVDDRDAPSGGRFVWLEGNFPNDYVTLEITISSAGTSEPYDEWIVRDYDYSNVPGVWVDGQDSPTIPHTSTHVIQRNTETSQRAAFGGTFRTPTNFYGWFNATIKITNSSQSNSYDTTVHNFDVYGDQAPV